MKLTVTTRPVRIDRYGIRTTVIYDDAKISKMLNNNFGEGSDFLKKFEQKILETIEPFIPRLSGQLIQTARQPGSAEGKGRIVWGGKHAPYAVKQYYTHRNKTGSNRGALWVERWQNNGYVGRILREISPQFGARGR